MGEFSLLHSTQLAVKLAVHTQFAMKQTLG